MSLTLDVQLAPPGLRRWPAPGETDPFARWFARAFYLDLGHRCNQSCRYCFQEKSEARFLPVDDLGEQIALAGALAITTPVLIGGEPLLHPDLEAILSRLRREGFSQWGLMSNGLLLADPGHLDRLVDLGLGFCQLSFDSPDAAVQNDLCRNPTLFPRLQKAIGNFHRHKDLPLVLNAVIVRPNVERLVALVQCVDALRDRLGIRPFLTLTHAKPHERMAPELMVSATAAAAAAVAAVREGRRLGLPVLFRNIPFCLAQGEERWSTDWFTRLRLTDAAGHLQSPPDEGLRKNGRCLLCAHQETCPGFLASYADRYGDQEFQPVGSPGDPVAEPDAVASEIRFPVGELRDGIPVYFHARELRGKLPGGGAGRRLVLVGPEPLLHPQLPELLREYATRGFSVWIATPALALAKPQRAGFLKSQGLAGVLWMHPARGSAHWVRTDPRDLPRDFRRRILVSLERERLPFEHLYPSGRHAGEGPLDAPRRHGQDNAAALGRGLTVSLLLGTRCNFRCEFCFLDDHRCSVERPGALATVERLLALGCRRFLLAGGEPTLYPHLPELIEKLAGAGAEAVLVSNGSALADRKSCRRLKSAGVSQVILSLHSHKSEVVARQSRVPDGLPRALDAFFHLLGEDVKVCVHHVFSAHNHRDFEDYVRFYAELLRQPGRSELSVSNIVMLSPVLRRHPERIPRLSEVAPHLAAGDRLAREYGFAIHRGASDDVFPECVFGIRENPAGRPAQRWIVPPARGKMGLIFAGAPEELPDVAAFGAHDFFQSFVHTRACRECRRRPVCLGVQSDYLALYGDSEFHAIR